MTIYQYQTVASAYRVETTEFSGLLYHILQWLRNDHLQIDVGVGEDLGEITANK
jgi:hypothetical protein